MKVNPAILYGSIIAVTVLGLWYFVKDRVKMAIWDAITDQRINTLHPTIRTRARAMILKAQTDLGIRLRITSALRTYEQQQALYDQGRSGPGNIVTNARPGHSFHNFGLAFDVVEIKDGKAIWDNPRWSEIGNLGKAFGFAWGGDWTSFKDKPHFEDAMGHNLATLRDRYETGQLVGTYVNVA